MGYLFSPPFDINRLLFSFIKEKKGNLDADAFDLTLNVPSDYKQIAAFIGDSKTGTTTVLDLTAKTLARKGKKVAVLDLSENKDLYYLNCWGDENITLEQQKALELLNKGIQHPIYIDDNYTLYSQKQGEELKEFDFLNAIEQIRYENDVILIDTDFTEDNEFLKFGVNAVYVVQDLNILSARRTKDYLKTLIQGKVNPRKINLVINKYIKCRVKPMDIHAMIAEPIPELEKNDVNSHINISSTMFIVNFELNNYTEFLESYMYVQNGEINISQEVKEQVDDICQHIYPAIQRETDGGKFDFKKLFRK